MIGPPQFAMLPLCYLSDHAMLCVSLGHQHFSQGGSVAFCDLFTCGQASMLALYCSLAVKVPVVFKGVWCGRCRNEEAQATCPPEILSLSSGVGPSVARAYGVWQAHTVAATHPLIHIHPLTTFLG